MLANFSSAVCKSALDTLKANFALSEPSVRMNEPLPQLIVSTLVAALLLMLAFDPLTTLDAIADSAGEPLGLNRLISQVSAVPAVTVTCPAPMLANFLSAAWMSGAVAFQASAATSVPSVSTYVPDVPATFRGLTTLICWKSPAP